MDALSNRIFSKKIMKVRGEKSGTIPVHAPVWLQPKPGSVPDYRFLVGCPF